MWKGKEKEKTTALQWVGSNLSDRQQYVKLGSHSSVVLLDCGSCVPQGSVLGSLLFAAYVAPVEAVIKSFGVRYQQYADDTQLYLSMRISDSTHHHSRRTTCVLDGGA